MPPRDGGVYVEAAGSIYGKPLQGDQQKRCKIPTPVGDAPAEPKPQNVTNR